MQEEAMVVSTKGKYAVVKLLYGENCEGCEICKNKEIKLTVSNDAYASVGSRVIISVDKMPSYLPVYAYIFPIFTMLFVYFLADKLLFKSEILSIALSFLFFAAHIFVMMFFFKKKNYRAYIMRII